MSSPLINSAALTAGEPTRASAPKINRKINRKKSGFQKNSASPKPRTVKVKAHTRKVTPKKTPAPQAAAVDPLNAQINAAADLKFGPQLANLSQQSNQSVYNQIRTGNWYTDYTNSLKSQQAAQNQAAANVAAALSQAFGQSQPGPSTGNANADALAQQAAQSRGYLGQSIAGTQSQMALNTANRFATGLVPAAQLAGGQAVQNEVNRRGQIQQQRADTLSQQGEYKTGLRQQAESASAKTDLENRKIAAAIAIQQGKNDVALQILNEATVPKIKEDAANKRSTIRIKKAQLAEKTAADNAALQAKSDAAAAKALGDPLKRSQFIAKYGLPPEQVAQMTPGQLSNFAKKNPQFEGYARPKGGAKGKAPTTFQLKGRQSILDAITRYQTGVKHGEALHEIAAHGREKNVSEAFLHAGADAVSKGFITQGTAKLLKQLGYPVPKEWTRPGAFPVTYRGK